MKQKPFRRKGDNMNYAMKKSLQSLGLAAVFSLVGTAAFAGVLKTPYMIYPGVNSQMEVLWQDNASESTNTLSWGTDTTYSMGSVTVPEYGAYNQHKYVITGLTPNTKYYYQVADATNGVYGSGSFITAPLESATAIRFLAMGDSRTWPVGVNNHMKTTKAFYSIPGNEDYQRLMIHNGDWVATDDESTWTTGWFDPAMTDSVALRANVPLNGCKGNHDNTSGFSSTFPKYFPFPYTNQQPCSTDPASPDYMSKKNSGVFACGNTPGYNYVHNLYWSYDYGPVHFTVLDEYSSYAPGSAQYAWLVNDLATTTKPWKILIYHEPAYSAGADSDNTTVRQLEPLVTQYNIDLIYCGHSHNYARTGAYTLAQANGDPIALNVPHITSGGGGSDLYIIDYTNQGGYPHVITGWQAFEFMTFDVKGKDLTMTAYQINNASLTSIVPLSSTFPADDGASTLSISPIETTVLHHYTNVSPQISATIGNPVYNRATKQYTGNVTLTNNGPALTGNVDVVLDGILFLQGLGTPSNQYDTHSPKVTSMIANKPATGKNSTDPGLLTTVTLTNATGSNNGEPMIQATTSGLATGASVTVPLTFSNPTNAKITFNPITYQE
jgi:predicted phosphodiesterase